MNFLLRRCVIAAVGGGASGFACAQPAAAAPGAVSGQITSVVIATLSVLAVIAAAAWLLKRLTPRSYGASGALRVIAAAAVGQRERVVVVEVGSTWLVVGVAPGSVSALHQMPRDEAAGPALVTAGASSPFAQWLKHMLDKRGEHTRTSNP
jgi:flagellar protein FliO/FliZ